MKKCKVSKNIITACAWLMEVSEAATLKNQKGILEWRYSNLETGKTTRTFFGVKSDKYITGLVFNFCPYCGVELRKAQDNE